ncbi:uncharacterized protein [Leptinotarsa decemlineata]|uniref:uncharacterized protein n=1 Tax=Leptinotarsa decemlineata TaxID=7539 RepID=UPI003D30D613
MFMKNIICALLVSLVSFVNGDDAPVPTTTDVEDDPEMNKTRIFTISDGNSTAIPEGTVQADDINLGETLSPDPASNFLQISNLKHKILGHHALSILQNISPIVKPLQEKLQRFKDYVNHPNSPHITIPIFRPLQLLNGLQQNGNYFLSGINSAIFGLANLDNYDYPFPYRRAGLIGKKEATKSVENI